MIVNYEVLKQLCEKVLENAWDDAPRLILCDFLEENNCHEERILMLRTFDMWNVIDYYSYSMYEHGSYPGSICTTIAIGEGPLFVTIHYPFGRAYGELASFVNGAKDDPFGKCLGYYGE